jgi:hypothetical protein
MAAVVIVAGALVFGVTGVSFAPYHTQSAPPAAAVDVKTQLGTAVTHAGFAADGTSMGYVQQHLGHALNCVEGTKGKNFNQSWGHVCQGQGNGILVDLKTASGGAAFMLVAESAGTLASNGLRSKDLTEAKAAAKGVGALLKVVAENLK